MIYTVCYRKRFFWKKVKVKGHRLDRELNRMDLFLPDGSIFSIGRWDRYDLKLGLDWLAMQKQQD